MGCGQSSSTSAISVEEGHRRIQTNNYISSYNEENDEMPAVDSSRRNDRLLPAVYHQEQREKSANETDHSQIQSSFKKMYTIKEISEHNSKKHFCELFPWKRGVHLSAIFKENIKPDVEEMESDPSYCTPFYAILYNHEKHDFENNWNMSPVAVVISKGLKFSKIKLCINQSKIADLNVYSDRQYYEDIHVDAKGVESDLRNTEDITVYQVEYLELLERFFQLFEKCNGEIPRHTQIPSGDPNEASFPLPDSVANDPTTIRQWAETWDVFDTEVSYENPWNCPWGYRELAEPVIDVLNTPDELYRESFYLNAEIFNHDIEGEAAWDVFQEDIVKNDTTTPEQDTIWEKRDKRSDLDDPDRMKRRRLVLANYFINERADGLTTYCDKYLGFADTLEEGWKKFQELCEKD